MLRWNGEQYTAMPESVLFPGLPATTLADFIRQGHEQGIIPMVRAFRAWVRTHAQP